ncbi:hypothetical protein SDC9_110641 [bioreactor metagenome]|uniref:Uncharacterized protein n=1 Tax=bioreactor metagenome TaxID=1076179 RepID=A0A645BFC4_9ZZZZ
MWNVSQNFICITDEYGIQPEDRSQRHRKHNVESLTEEQK